MSHAVSAVNTPGKRAGEDMCREADWRLMGLARFVPVFRQRSLPSVG